MNFRITKENIKKYIKKLNESYQPTEEKPLLKIAELALILPALGLFYLWEYFNKYGIHYYLYFDLKDSLAVLYENLMPVIYISVILSMLLTLLIPNLIKNKNNAMESQSVETADTRQKKKFSKLAVIFTIVIALSGFCVLLNVYQFGLLAIVIFLVFAALSSYLYLFSNKNLGFGVAIILAFIYSLNIANKDAKYNMAEKPRLNILLKNHSDIPILTELDTCRYLIYKTSNYYFIKDDCKKMIFTYSISTGEMTSFTVK